MGEEKERPELLLGKRIQDFRRRAGLTQQGLCQKANLSYSTLAKIERGAIVSPSIFTVLSIAVSLETSVDNLIGLSSSPMLAGRSYKKSKSGVSFVYFDVNGCLVRSTQRGFSKIAEDYGISSDLVESAFWHFNDEVNRGDITMAEFNRDFGGRLGIKDLDWTKYYLESADPVPGVAELVKWVSENYRVGLLTNIMPGFLDKMFASGQLPNVKFDSIVDSSEVKSIKPEAKIYEIAADKSGCQPSEILLVDDTRANLTAAEKQDWKVLWFDYATPEESFKNIREALKTN